jgi:hypothetical protein
MPPRPGANLDQSERFQESRHRCFDCRSRGQNGPSRIQGVPRFPGSSLEHLSLRRHNTGNRGRMEQTPIQLHCLVAFLDEC